jgi:hypothetical protein
VLTVGSASNFFMRARPRHGRSTPSAKKISHTSQGIRESKHFRAYRASNDNRTVRKRERPHIVIIKMLYSEVRLDPIRETHGYGQGSGLSGEAESRVAGFRFAPFAAAN